MEVQMAEYEPTQRRPLSPELRERVKKVVAVISEVLPQRLDRWVDDLTRRQHPEAEIRVWEKVAGKLLLLTAPSDSLAFKRDVLGVMLNCAWGVTRGNVLAVDARSLTRDDIAKVVAAWRR
jgi:hypothetical protein